MRLNYINMFILKYLRDNRGGRSTKQILVALDSGGMIVNDSTLREALHSLKNGKYIRAIKTNCENCGGKHNHYMLAEKGMLRL